MKTRSKTSEFMVLVIFGAGFLLGNILEYKRIMGFEPMQIGAIALSLGMLTAGYMFLRKGFK